MPGLFVSTTHAAAIRWGRSAAWCTSHCSRECFSEVVLGCLQCATAAATKMHTVRWFQGHLCVEAWCDMCQDTECATSNLSWPPNMGIRSAAALAARSCFGRHSLPCMSQGYDSLSGTGLAELLAYRCGLRRVCCCSNHLVSCVAADSAYYKHRCRSLENYHRGYIGYMGCMWVKRYGSGLVLF